MWLIDKVNASVSRAFPSGRVAVSTNEDSRPLGRMKNLDVDLSVLIVESVIPVAREK